MLSLNLGVEENAPTLRVETHPELDVLDRCAREARVVTPLVEAAELEEDVAPDRPESGPECLRNPGTLLMDVVVEQVSEVGDDPARVRIVVV